AMQIQCFFMHLVCMIQTQGKKLFDKKSTRSWSWFAKNLDEFGSAFHVFMNLVFCRFRMLTGAHQIDTAQGNIEPDDGKFFDKICRKFLEAFHLQGEILDGWTCHGISFLMQTP